MRSVPAAQPQLRNVSIRSRADVIPASTPITVSVVPAVHDPRESPGVAVGSGRRAIVLAVCCSALFMVGLDNTIVNVGLPEIGKSLHTSVAGLQWTVAGYTIVLASLLMFSGAAADRIGRRTIFQVGLSLFTLGSWLCSLAPSLSWLIAFRVLQGVGGSMLNPAALGIITNTFTTPADRAKAIGIWDGVNGLSMALGPVIGGILVGTVASRRSFSCHPHVAYPIIQGPANGWFSVQTVGFFLLSVTSLMILLRYEPRRADPLIDLRFFKSVPFSAANATAVCAIAASAGFLFLTTLYLQDLRGFTALRAGLTLLPMPIMMAVSSPISGRILAPRGPRVPFVIAGAALTLSTAALSQLSVSSGSLFLIATYGLFGIGAGMVNVPISNGVMSGVPKSQAGVASGMNSSSRQLGQSLGVAIVGSVLAASLRGSLHGGFLEAAHAGWWIMAGCGYAVLVLGVIATTQWAKATAVKAGADI